MFGVGPMAFLFAHCADGSIRHFEKAELAFFFPNSVGKLLVQGGLTFAEYEIIVFGDLQWFKGTVDCHDYAYDSPSAKAVSSLSYPTAPQSQSWTFLPLRRRNPYRRPIRLRKSVRLWQQRKSTATSSSRLVPSWRSVKSMPLSGSTSMFSMSRVGLMRRLKGETSGDRRRLKVRIN